MDDVYYYEELLKNMENVLDHLTISYNNIQDSKNRMADAILVNNQSFKLEEFNKISEDIINQENKIRTVIIPSIEEQIKKILM